MAIYKDILLICENNKILEVFETSTLTRRGIKNYLKDECQSLLVANDKLFIGGENYILVYSLPDLTLISGEYNHYITFMSQLDSNHMLIIDYVPSAQLKLISVNDYSLINAISINQFMNI